MEHSIHSESEAPALHDDSWHPRPELLRAMQQIATIADGDDTAIISDRSITFQNHAERTTISAVPINIDTYDGLRITECITIRTPLTTFKLFDENRYAFINIFATTGAVVRGSDGEDAIVSRLPLFEDDDEALADLYTPLIANAARLHLIGPLCGADLMQDRKEQRGAAEVALPGWDEPSYWGAHEFEGAKERLRHNGAYANAGPDGLTVEFPWEQGAVSAGLGDCTSLLQIRADEPHPTAGNGLFFRLDLPLRLSDEDTQRWAAKLNRAEAEAVDAPPFFGAWCCLPDSGTLSFAGFWPNLLYKQGTVTNIAFWSWARSRFARQVIGNSS